MKLFFAIVLGLLLAACATGGAAIPEPESDGAKVFLAKCTKCHSWPHPSRHSEGEWDHYLDLMGTEMEKRNMKFAKDDKESIRAYLHKHAR